ncbi:MAG: ABC transporter permease [Gammaproteobacteria bacterium]|nr:ABC transporter permease [Gammaproteobacteria bacterium]
MMASRNRSLAPYLVACILPACVLLAWEIAGRGDGQLPPPTRIVQAWGVWLLGETGGGTGVYSGTWLADAWVSTVRVLKGILVATLVGVPLGILIGWSRRIADFIDAPVQLTRPIPITAWVPFSMILFGVADGSTVFLIALGAFYPIVVNTTHGVRQIRRTLIRAASMMGCGRLQLLWRVALPAALPNVLTGLRLGVGVGWVCVVVGEMIAVKSGLGYVLWDSLTYKRMDITIISMLSMGLLGALTDLLIVLLSRRLLRWQALESQ